VPVLDPPVCLAECTTLRLGGPAARFVDAHDEAELLDEIRQADDNGESLLVIGAGSNLVVADAGFPGTVLRVAFRGIRWSSDGDRLLVDIAAGEVWDDVVVAAIAEGCAGLECLSGIPGLTGATPVQNVGAYGAEIADVCVGVRVYDRLARRVRWLAGSECRFGYRHSILKNDDRYVVLTVRLSLRRSRLSTPIRYQQLADALGVPLGDCAPVDAVRKAVLELRAAKGMLLDPGDPDTVSAGSFFTNPIVPDSQAPPEAPRFPAHAPGLVKIPAAWLIEQAGFAKGHRLDGVGISSKHALALVNRGGSTADLLELARRIRAAVQEKFGILLDVEPRLVGVRL